MHHSIYASLLILNWCCNICVMCKLDLQCESDLTKDTQIGEVNLSHTQQEKLGHPCSHIVNTSSISSGVQSSRNGSHGMSAIEWMCQSTKFFCLCSEMMDAMRKSRKFTYTSFLSVIWNLLLLVPHSFALVLALPGPITAQCKLPQSVNATQHSNRSLWSDCHTFLASLQVKQIIGTSQTFMDHLIPCQIYLRQGLHSGGLPQDALPQQYCSVSWGKFCSRIQMHKLVLYLVFKLIVLICGGVWCLHAEIEASAMLQHFKLRSGLVALLFAWQLSF